MPVPISAFGHCACLWRVPVDPVRARPVCRAAHAVGRLHAGVRWLSIVALMMVETHAVRAHAADVAVHVAISPEVAYLVREWRRAHGLPQEPEAALPQAVGDGRSAIRHALRLIGMEDPMLRGRRISVVRAGAHWRVTIEAQGEAPGYVVDIADSIANPNRSLSVARDPR